MEEFSKTANRCTTEAEGSEFQTSVPCANLIKMKTFSVYFDELEHYFNENGQKEHT